MNTDALRAELRKIVRSEVLGPGMQITLFEDGEVVFVTEDEEGHQIATNASTFDKNWEVRLESVMLAAKKLQNPANTARVRK